MVQMFKALESSGLRGFLGCSSSIYEASLVEFFHNASVRDDKVVGAVQGKSVEISEELFAGTFELPTEGLTEMTEVPKDLVFDARSAFSMSGHDDSCFEASPRVCGADLYSFEGGTRPDLELGESKAFPPLKILTAKIVGTYISKNKNIAAEEVLEMPQDRVVKKATTNRRQAPAVVEAAAKKKRTTVGIAATNRRPAPAVVEAAAKKKRTTVGRAAPANKNFAMVPVVQNPEPISVVPVVTPRAQQRKAPKRKLVLRGESDDEIVDNIIHQVITETSQIETGETDFKEPVVMETARTDPVATKSRIDVSAITNNEEGSLVETEKEKAKEKEKDIKPLADEGMSIEKIIDSEDTEPLSKPTRIKFGLGIEIKGVQEGDLYKASLPQIDAADKGKAPLVETDTVKGYSAREMFTLICADIDFLVQIREKVIEEIVSFFHSFSLRRLAVLESVSDMVAKEEQMLQWAETDSLQTAVQRRMYIIAKYREMLLRKFLEARSSRSENPSSSSSRSSSGSRMLLTADDLPENHPSDAIFPDVETHAVQISMPISIVSSHYYTEEFAQLRATVDKIHLKQVQTLGDIDDLKAVLTSRMSHLERSVQNDSTHHGHIFRHFIREVQEEVKTLKADLNAFRQETQTGIATLTTQLSEIMTYLNRGRDGKKGEVSSSRGPQPPPYDRNRPGSGDGGRGRGSSSEPSRKRKF
ncbi:hypothetical protein F511_32125 [Dorcoceras hygrometricum]|uniref:Uncharacterized protein n=1 Tax=Dorcoceras hygrometricum TaxID=472368 RepID=A0A2Z7CYS3_9LAMI|nr:hypothetical protein F511_32125 [Dorcoceras hygrometricum]